MTGKAGSVMDPALSESSFEQIRREDADGEHWMASQLLPMFGVDAHQEGPDIMERATAAARNSGQDFLRHLRPITRAGRVVDIRLTRYGAYLLAMNADPRRPQVGAAQTYFAVRTREAEVAQRPQSTLDVLRVALDEIEAAQRVAARAERLAVSAHDRINTTQTRVTVLEGGAEYVALVNWAESHGYPTEMQYLSAIGKKIKAKAVERGEHMGSRPHPLFARGVKLYRPAFLDEVFPLVAGPPPGRRRGHPSPGSKQGHLFG